MVDWFIFGLGIIVALSFRIGKSGQKWIKEGGQQVIPELPDEEITPEDV